jgi:hypothetical protein
MSAPRQLIKRQKQERKRRRKQEAIRRRQRKRQAGPTSMDCLDSLSAVRGPVGGIKMSTVLEEFVAPRSDAAEGFEAYSKVLSMGVVAWNAALQPEQQRAAFVSSAIEAAMNAASLHERLMCQELIDDLIARKLRYFARYHRPILAFHLEELDDGGLYLSVASAVC